MSSKGGVKGKAKGVSFLFWVSWAGVPAAALCHCGEKRPDVWSFLPSGRHAGLGFLAMPVSSGISTTNPSSNHSGLGYVPSLLSGTEGRGTVLPGKQGWLWMGRRRANRRRGWCEHTEVENYSFAPEHSKCRDSWCADVLAPEPGKCP